MGFSQRVTNPTPFSSLCVCECRSGCTVVPVMNGHPRDQASVRSLQVAADQRSFNVEMCRSGH